MSATTTETRFTRAALLLWLLGVAACGTQPKLETGDPLIERGGPGQGEMWRRDVGRAVQIPPTPIDNDWIVAPTEGPLYRLRGKDGDEQWKRKLRATPTAAPVLCGGNLIVATDLPAGEVLCIAPKDGTIKWKWGRSIGFIAAADSFLVFAGRGGRVLALDPERGTVKWERSHPGSGWRPLVVDGTRGLAFVPVRPDTVLAFDREGTVTWAERVGNWPRVALTAEGLLVATDDSTLLELDPATGNERARRALGAMVAGSPVVENGVAYLALRSGVLLAVDARTLEERWRIPFEPPLLSAPLLAGDRIVQSGTRGRVYLVSPTGAPFDTLHHPEAVETSPGFAEERLAVGGAGGTVVLYRKQSG